MKTSREISKFFFTTVPVLESLPSVEAKAFRAQLRLKRVRKGKELFKEGSYPREVYIVRRGKVKLYQHSPDGSQTIVYIYSAGEMFGYRPLLCGEKHPASAMTIEDCGIYSISASRFLNFLTPGNSLSTILLRNLSHEFTVLVNRIGAFDQKTVKERLAMSLFILREKYRKAGNNGQVEITLSRTDLASYVGTSAESVARVLTRFRQAGLIRTVGRKITIINERALLHVAD
jgi:CRP-like cAMP-binding protein